MDPARSPLPPHSSPPVLLSSQERTHHDQDSRRSHTSHSHVVVTPPPSSSVQACGELRNTDTRTCSFPKLDFLCTLLGISRDSDAEKALDCFLAKMGSETLDDLAFIQAQDFEHAQSLSSLSPTIQRKLLRVAAFVDKGGSLDHIRSMKELVSDSAMRAPPQALSTNEATTTRTASDEAIVALDVGGHHFTTTKATLCRVPGTLLESMFSGRHQNPCLRKKDGSHVIDRNGTHFQHILDFLRVGAVISLPPNAEAKEALAIEADYYGLDDLVRAIRMPQVDVTEYLSDEVLSMRKDEATLRKAFKTGSTAGFDPHQGLIPLFCPDDGIQPMPMRYETTEDNPKNAVLMENLREKPFSSSMPAVTVGSIGDFQTNFNREHPNVLHRLSSVLREENVVIAGGSVLRALTSSNGIRTANWWGKKSDIDLFLYDCTPSEANRIARRIWFALAVDHERWVIMRSRGVITMHNWNDHGPPARVDLKIQIVLRLYDSPSEVLLGFDCDCCCCAYDGIAVWATPRCIRALRTGVNILNPLHAWPNKASYELRLAKYAYRGFSVVVPGLDKNRIDYHMLRRTDLCKLKGLARLLKIAFEMDEAPNEVSAFPQHPLQDPMLREHVKSDMDFTQLLAEGMVSGYDNPVTSIIIPPTYGYDGTARAMMWYEWNGGNGGNEYDFPLARDCRDDAWTGIVSAGSLAPEGTPERLIDGWDTEKRSREYLNSEMDTFDLDNIYYNHAFGTGDAI